MFTLTHSRLLQVLDYDQKTGVFTWKYPINNRIKVGNAAGWGSDGYINISIDGQIYGAHRLAWFFVTASWPKKQIDHIDGNRSNNSFSNLREATISQNHFNIGKTASNKTGFKGVSWFKRTRKWRARITVSRKGRTIGYFDTKEEAHEAYKAAAAEYHGEFANPGNQ
jgi:hypothetical protein